MSRFVKQKSFAVTGAFECFHISRLSSDRAWISDWDKLILTNIAGDKLYQLGDIMSNRAGIHTINNDGDLIFIHMKNNICKLCTVNNIMRIHVFLKYTAPWRPLCVYSSPFTGDLLVGMRSTDTREGKVNRYNSKRRQIHVIPNDNKFQKMYISPSYITENRNGDVIVSDIGCNAVVVTDRHGNHRFSYTGPPSESGLLLPLGICTDALSHILVCDYNSETIQMIDENGQFLSIILTHKEGIYGPGGLSYDDKTNLLWVGSFGNNTVNIFKCMDRDSMAGIDVDDNLKCNFEDSYLNLQSNTRHQQIHRREEIKDFSNLKSYVHKQTHILTKLNTTQNGKEESINRENLEKKEDAKELPSGSKNSLLALCDTLEPQPDGIQKTESDREPHEKEKNCGSSDTTFNTKLKQLKENGEFESRIQRLKNHLNIETYLQSERGYNIKSNNFMETIHRVDYLDCSGLYFSKAEKQSKNFKQLSQSGVEDFLGWMADCDKVFRKTQSLKCRLILSNLFLAYTKEKFLKFKSIDFSFIHRCLNFAIEHQNHILILEVVKWKIFDFDFHLHKLFKDKKIPFVVLDTFLSTAKSMILRKCPRLRQNAFRLSFCCECSQEERLVILMLYKGSKEMKDGIPEKAIGVDLVLINYTQPSDEASTVLRSISAPRLSRNLPVITENYARKLFKKHSNLTLISASPYKSSGYLKGKHIIVEKHCISLLCLHKGYIPFGEREFPKQINGFEVDVQEGYCTLGSGRSIDVGGHIRRARGINTPGHGSIGGFVDLSNGSVGLITCAHVVFSTDELFKANSEIEDYVLCRNTDLNVEFFDRNEHNFEVCGNIVKKCFPSSVDDISVDAALIELDQSVNEFGFPVVLADQLYLAGFEPNKPPVFTGEVVSFPDPETERHRSSDVSQRSGIPGRLNSVIKYGSQTRFTIGNFYFDRVHIRFLNNTLDLPGRNGFATMYNQIEIQSLPHGTFFEAGDSGAFVFCINVDKTLSCLGMAIGSSTRGSCLVTPMTRILDSFSLPHSLKPCSAFNPTNTSQGSQSEQQNNASAGVDLGTILLNLQTSITNIQTELGNFRSEVQSEVGNLSAQVQEIKDRFQTKLPGSSDNTNKK